MLTLTIAWRSFIRHRWRSSITVAAVALGLAMLLVFVGIADDGHARMAELGIRMGSGHVLVEGRGYRDAQTLDYLVHDADAVADELARLPNVRSVAVRLRTSGLLSAGERSAPVLVSGAAPARELAASDIVAPKNRVAGDYVRARADMPFANQAADIYLGKTLAEQLGVAVDDRVVLTVSPPGGSEPASAAFRVSGIFRTGVNELDDGWVEIPIDEARTILGLPGAATEVACISDLPHSDALTGAVRNQLGSKADLSVVPWQEALRELHDALVLDDAGLYLMMAIVFLVVDLGIFNTVLMSVTERTRELGVMMALGTSGRRMFSLILVEAVILAAVSLVIGVGIGLGLHLYVQSHGIDVTQFAGEVQFAGINWSGRIYSTLTPSIVLRWTFVVGVVVLVSALYPAWRVTRLEPVEAMHHV
ncbi:MAG: ABC transporter permease [Myxococcales bacterium]|nr:ABC transporter permease [Myxococcales bacterium]